MTLVYTTDAVKQVVPSQPTRMVSNATAGYSSRRRIVAA